MPTKEQAPELTTGQALMVRYETKGGELSFESAIREVIGDRVHVLPPASSGRDLYAGKQVNVMVQVGDAAYQFISQVLSLDDDCVLARPAELRLVEKRQHYRLQIGLVPSYAAITDDHGVDDRATRLTVIDISAGGLQFVSRYPFPPGARIHIWLPLDDYRIDCVVHVVNARTPAAGRSNFRYNTRFVSISDDDGERVARFVFRKQLELRRRG